MIVEWSLLGISEPLNVIATAINIYDEKPKKYFADEEE